MKENGRTTSSTVKEERHGEKKEARMLFIQDSSIRERRTERADSNGKMVPTMRVILWTATLWGTVDTILRIWTNTTKVNLEVRTWKARESRPGLTVADMKVILRMVKKTEKVLSSGQTVSSTSALGEMANNTELVSFITLRKALRNKESGRTASVSDGSLVPRCSVLLPLHESREFEMIMCRLSFRNYYLYHY